MVGTNYYVVENACECCNRYDEKVHIGKSSWGWAFTFQGYKYDGLTSWQSYKEFLKDKDIRDEYGDKIKYDDFVEYIETKKSPGYVHEKDGRKNLVHNAEGRKEGWFNSEYDWDDSDGYSFGSREFS
jgi:hypothetical protein